MLYKTLVGFVLALLFRFLATGLFRLPRQRFVAVKRGVSIQEVVIECSIVSNAETPEGPVGESADLSVVLVHEQVSEAVGEAMVEHAPHPMAHVSLFHTAHGTGSFQTSPSLVLCRIFGSLPDYMSISELVEYERS